MNANLCFWFGNEMVFALDNQSFVPIKGDVVRSPRPHERMYRVAERVWNHAPQYDCVRVSDRIDLYLVEYQDGLTSSAKKDEQIAELQKSNQQMFRELYKLTNGALDVKIEGLFKPAGIEEPKPLSDDLRRLNALAEQLKKTVHRIIPMPYVWWHTDQQNWWLSTQDGSRAVGTFDQATLALADLIKSPSPQAG